MVTKSYYQSPVPQLFVHLHLRRSPSLQPALLLRRVFRPEFCSVGGRLPRASLLARCMNWDACFNRIAARGTVITVWCVASDSISASPSNRRRLGQCSHLPIGSAQANSPAITAGSLPAALSESVVMRLPWSVARTMSWLCSRSASRGRPVSMSPLVSPGSNYTMRVGAFKRKDQHRSRRKGKHYFSNSLTGKKISLSTIALVDDDTGGDARSAAGGDYQDRQTGPDARCRAFLSGTLSGNRCAMPS